MKDIKTILEEKNQSVKLPEAFGIHTQWQEKAFRYATALEIKLEGSYKGRWLKMFKMAAHGVKSNNLERAYSYLKDHPKAFTNEHKIRFFFWIYNKGIDNSLFKAQ